MGELYSRFAPRAFGVARRVLRSDAEAEEVVQDSFLEVWRTATRYDPRRAAPERWILTIVRTRAIDRLRQHGARVRMGDSIGREPAPAPMPAADDRISEVREAKRLRDAMEKLPSEQRKALEQAYDQGLTQSEIASATNTPLGTVKTRMRIGMMKLAELLET